MRWCRLGSRPEVTFGVAIMSVLIKVADCRSYIVSGIGVCLTVSTPRPKHTLNTS